MFDFQDLSVYQKSKIFNKQVTRLILESNYNSIVQNQLRRASLSIMLNIAEGSSRISRKDRRRFMIIARGSAYECASVFEYLYDNGLLVKSRYIQFSNLLLEISKMLYGFIKSLED